MRFSVAIAGIILTSLAVIFLKTNGSVALTLDTVDSKNPVNLIKYENFNISINGYDFAFETSDGVYRKETATVKNIGTADEAISVEGTVSWVGPDGVQYTLNYLADENGFQPHGKHLPVAPET